MPTLDRPKAKLENGKMNPEYTKWYRAKKSAKKKPVAKKQPAKAVVAEEKPIEQFVEAAFVNNNPACVIVTPAPANLLTLKCVKSAKNPSWVFCDLNGVKVPVRCKRGLSKKLPGKKIKVSSEMVDEKMIYSHVR